MPQNMHGNLHFPDFCGRITDETHSFQMELFCQKRCHFLHSPGSWQAKIMAQQRIFIGLVFIPAQQAAQAIKNTIVQCTVHPDPRMNIIMIAPDTDTALFQQCFFLPECRIFFQPVRPVSVVPEQSLVHNNEIASQFHCLFYDSRGRIAGADNTGTLLPGIPPKHFIPCGICTDLPTIPDRTGICLDCLDECINFHGRSPMHGISASFSSFIIRPIARFCNIFFCFSAHF